MNVFASKIGDIVKAVANGNEKVDIYNNFNSVVIVAAGNGTRMGINMAQTKQMTDLDGIPVVVRAINQFEACDFINEIIVVARADELSFYDEFNTKYCFKKVIKVVTGGITRQKSVLEGIKNINENSEYVIIHDGARCLVLPGMIKEVLEKAYTYGCATAAEKSKDTVKISDKGGFIASTIDRSYLWHAQTPQIFKTEIYRAAALIADKNNFEATDDCMLIENLGYKIKLVDCGYENIKITTPDDFIIAEAILKKRKSKSIKNG